MTPSGQIDRAQTLDADWPTLARTSATIIPVVALMTWGVMPRLSRLLRRWLYPSPR